MADGVKKTGDWQGARKTAKGLLRNTKIAERRTLDKFLDRMKFGVKRHMIADDLGWQQLSDYTIRKKKHDTKLIETGKYYLNIKSWKQGSIGYVGIRDGVTEKNGTSVGEVAKRQEEGFANNGHPIPPRKLWKPTAEEVYAEMKAGHDNIAEMLYKLIRNGI